MGVKTDKNANKIEWKDQKKPSHFYILLIFFVKDLNLTNVFLEIFSLKASLVVG